MPAMRSLIALVLVTSLTGAASAQYRQNFGLVRHQPDSTLPRGKAPFDIPVRKAKASVSTAPTAIDIGEYLLNRGWEMADALTALKGQVLSDGLDTKDWYDATVPGTVLTTLVDQGVYPDPYMGLNNMAIPDTLCRQDWWYRLSFPTPAPTAGKHAWLHFDGINYKAIFFLNGKLLGQTQGAFRRTRFDVTGHLRTNGRNTLVVHILPPPNPGIPHEQSFLAGMGPNGGQLALDGPTFISSEGWDWVPGIRDRNIGIWQDVRLRYTGDVAIIDPQVVTDLPLPDTSRADITIRVGLENHSDRQVTKTLRAAIGDISVEQSVTLAAGEKRIVELSPGDHRALSVAQPKLWWPNGYGAQHLHHLRLTVTGSNGSVSDMQTVRFGIRELSYELMVDAPHRKGWRILFEPTGMRRQPPPFDNIKRREFEKRIFIPSLRPGIDTASFQTLSDANNPFLVVRVNGRRIFCRGGNWGMDDGMKRVPRERLEPYFKLHRHANYNMIRNWTGESTQESFYELADEYGMLVWNDFWTSTEGYNLNPLDQHLFLDNTLDAIRRFRNHPSIALWCPRNEGYAPEGMEEPLYRQLVEEDGTRHYIGNSREINLRQSGDWHYIEDPSLYFTRYAEGFSTEIGTFSAPLATTIRKFIKPEDQWPINDVWHYHDLHSNNQNLPGYLKALDSLYGKPTGLDDFSRKAQLVNYESHRAIFEGWNHRMWDRGSGVLLWMTHPAWPSMIWQTYTWDGETHGSYYGAKKACEPVHVQLNRHDNRIVLVNATLQALQALRLEYAIHGADGKRVFVKSMAGLSIPADDKVVMEAPDAGTLALPSTYMVRLRLMDAGGRLLSVNEYWRTSAGNNHFRAFNGFGEQPIVVRRLPAGAEGRMAFQLQNGGKSPIVGIRLNLADAMGRTILPGLFSDGYFTLMPGEKRDLTVDVPADAKGMQLITEAYNSAAKTHRL
jgi:beta-galactosidase/beta-glucuronidase